MQTLKVTEYYDDRTDDSSIWYKTLAPNYRLIPPDQLPAGMKLGYSLKTMAVNPMYYLPWIKAELDRLGVRFIRAEVQSISEAQAVINPEQQNMVIINASGLGALNIAGDRQVVAVRGQTIMVRSDLQEVTMTQGSQYTYAIPRMYTGCVVIGGVAQEGNLDRTVNPDTRRDILRRVTHVCPETFGSTDLQTDVARDIVGFRPSRKGGYRLEREGNNVHAYGFGSLGYTYSYGVGLKVREIVDGIAAEKRKSRL